MSRDDESGRVWALLHAVVGIGPTWTCIVRWTGSYGRLSAVRAGYGALEVLGSHGVERTITHGE